MSAREVLIVDDEPAIREYVGLVLARLGVNALKAEDGHAALSALSRHQGIALVLLDVHMPRLDGLEVLTRARALRPGLPVVILSGDPGDEDHARARGASGFLAKPFSQGELAEVVARSVPAREAGCGSRRDRLPGSGD